MRKAFKIEDLDCANCAAKLEKAVAAVDGVKKASVSFMAQKIIIEAEAEDFDTVMKEVVRAGKKAVPEARIIV